MSLRWRFALLFAGGAVLATALAAAAAFVTTSRALYSEIDSHLVERAALAASFPFAEALEETAFHDPVEFEVREKIESEEALKREYRNQGLWKDLFGADSVFQWSDLDSGRPLLFMGRAPLLPVLDPAAVRRPHRFDTVRIGETPYRMLTTRVTRGSVIQIARNISEQEEVLALLGFRFLLIGLLVTAAAGGGGWLLARRVTRPVEILTKAAAEVAETRELLEPIDTGAAGEVGRLADSFNSMIAALRDSRAQQRRLIQNASHELRTPLASLRTNIEVLERAEELEPEERRRMLADIHHELKELTTLVIELAALASEESQAPDEPAQTLGLEQIARASAERASRRTQRTIRVTGEGASVEARAGALQRAVDNLLDNALKWGPPGRAVEIVLSGGELAVRDRGPGIPEDDLPYVFDRFYRAAEARSRPGSGLGLSIVKEIAESHGGRVHAANRPGGGAQVGFTLPV